MPRLLILAVHRPDRSPSQRFRIEQYIDFLSNHGYQIHFSWLLNKTDDKVFYSPAHLIGKTIVVTKGVVKRLSELIKPSAYDIVFIQREAIMLGTPIIERLWKSKRAKIVYDFDDSIWLSDVSNANKKFSWLKNPSKTSSLIRCAHLVFAGNEYLAQYARDRNENVHIVPTTIDLDEYKPNHNDKSINGQVCIGWSGSTTTIKHFETVIPVLKEIKSIYKDKVSFSVIGDGGYTNQALEIKGVDWSKENELKDLSSMDIGMMPLPDDMWAKGKCGLKGLQYMAMEVATIMSPVGVNTDIINHRKNGILAEGQRQWIDSLTELIDNFDFRQELGLEGRKTVADKYSTESQREKYLELLNSLL